MVVGLSAGLQRLGHQVDVVCLRDLGEPPVDLQPLFDGGVSVTALKKPEGIHPKTVRNLAEVARRRNIELIHTHNHLVHHYGAAGGLILHVPVVNTLHGIDTLNMPVWASGIYLASCLASDRIVSVSQPVQAALRRKYPLPAGKLAVIENGIPLEEYCAIPARPAGSPVVFGTVGRLVEVKDHANLLRAFAALRRECQDVRLKILGVGPLETDLHALAESLGLAGAMEFCGFTRQPAAFYAGIDVFVLPSRSEGLPMTLLEAMASALPAVATAVGGIPDVLTAESGWLCPPGDSAALAVRLKAALDADRPRMGLQAREIVLARYSQQSMVQAYARLYRALRPD